MLHYHLKYHLDHYHILKNTIYWYLMNMSEEGVAIFMYLVESTL